VIRPWLCFALFAFALWYGFSSLESLNHCVEWRASLAPLHEITGWHTEGDIRVRCYGVEVVDFRE